MKKALSGLLGALLLFLCACSQDAASESSPGASDSPEILDSSPCDTTGAVYPVQYASVDELLKGLADGYSEEFLNSVEQSEGADNRGNFRGFIEYVREEGAVYVPYFDDMSIALERDGSYSIISVSPVDMYGQPCIFFSLPRTGKISFIKTVCLGAALSDEIIAESNEKGVTWLIDQLDPSAKENFAANIESLYEEEITLKDRTLLAQFEQFKGDERIRISFVFDDMLISVWGLPEALGAEWLARLDFKPVELSSAEG